MARRARVGVVSQARARRVRMSGPEREITRATSRTVRVAAMNIAWYKEGEVLVASRVANWQLNHSME
jgi:hypothetical protein